MHTDRKAFTLIELLVVIAIISLLVSILLPSLQKAKALSRSAVCMSTERGLGLSVMFYCQEQAPGRLITSGAGWSGAPTPYPLRLYENSFIDNYAQIRCPSWSQHNTSMSDAQYEDPEYNGGTDDRGVNSFAYAYGIRTWYTEPDGTDVWEPFVPANASAMPYGIDSTAVGYSDPHWFNRGQCYRLDGPIGWTGGVHMRHMGGANLLYGDGHVEHVSLRQLSEYATGGPYSSRHRMFFHSNYVRAEDPAYQAN
jgi:prepilin-type N-terminal cleavage/methylation domain-containing protein/prepilin-type processing-associated H-X9-DG protein